MINFDQERLGIIQSLLGIVIVAWKWKTHSKIRDDRDLSESS